MTLTLETDGLLTPEGSEVSVCQNYWVYGLCAMFRMPNN
jgi:hypothetical protein